MVLYFQVQNLPRLEPGNGRSVSVRPLWTSLFILSSVVTAVPIAENKHSNIFFKEQKHKKLILLLVQWWRQIRGFNTRRLDTPALGSMMKQRQTTNLITVLFVLQVAHLQLVKGPAEGGDVGQRFRGQHRWLVLAELHGLTVVLDVLLIGHDIVQLQLTVAHLKHRTHIIVKVFENTAYVYCCSP